MAVETIHTGDILGHEIGYPNFDDAPDKTWGDPSQQFENVELVFAILFCVEIVLKVAGLGKRFVEDPWNWFDAALVIGWITENFGASVPLDTTFLRLLRLARLLRIVRIARKIQGLDALVVMTTALQGSLSAFFWASTLLLAIQMLFALLLGQMLVAVIEDESAPLESRMEAFKYFGNFPRGMLTMVELTLGNFAPVARMLQEHVSPFFVIFSILHKLSFGFAGIAVVNGVFMAETFNVAASDDSIMLRSMERVNRQHKKKMLDFMTYADHSEDGVISCQEWDVVLQNESARNWFAGQGLSIEDNKILFHLLEKDGNGTLDAEELLQGVAQLKGPARSLDVCLLQKEQAALQHTVDESLKKLQAVDIILAKQSTVEKSLQKLASLLDDSLRSGSYQPLCKSQKDFELKIGKYLKENTNVELMQTI